MLRYNDEVLRPQNLGAVAIANYTFIIGTYHQIHIYEYSYMVDTLKVSTLSIILTGKKTNHKQHKL